MRGLQSHQQIWIIWHLTTRWHHSEIFFPEYKIIVASCILKIWFNVNIFGGFPFLSLYVEVKAMSQAAEREDQLCILFQTLVLHFFVTIFFTIVVIWFCAICNLQSAINFAPSLLAWTRDRWMSTHRDRFAIHWMVLLLNSE